MIQPLFKKREKSINIHDRIDHIVVFRMAVIVYNAMILRLMFGLSPLKATPLLDCQGVLPLGDINFQYQFFA